MRSTESIYFKGDESMEEDILRGYDTRLHFENEFDWQKDNGRTHDSTTKDEQTTSFPLPHFPSIEATLADDSSRCLRIQE